MIQFSAGKSSKSRKPTFMTKASMVDDPLADVKMSDSLEVDARAELDALTVAYRERKSNEDKRFKQATDSEYWVAVCFESREQKDAFLRASHTAALGDKYVDGKRFAAMLGIPIPD